MYYPAVAHNCHGKTKSHGTTNFTHGKTELTWYNATHNEYRHFFFIVFAGKT